MEYSGHSSGMATIKGSVDPSWLSLWPEEKKIDCKDHLSDLPDPVIQQILSFLVAKDVVRTSVLSKRWRSLWTAVPTLDFHHRTYVNEFVFARFINKTLKLHAGCKVEKLFIRFAFDKSLTSDADGWIRFAISRKVEVLHLDFGRVEYFVCLGYPLLESIYSNSLLKSFHTTLCDFKPRDFSWGSLKDLSIGYTIFYNDTITKILLGSPLLEFLKLHNCTGSDKLILSSWSLKELEIEKFQGRDGSVMEISCPRLRSLDLSGHMSGRQYKLINHSPSLVKANLNFMMDNDVVPDNHCNMLKQLLEKLHYVEELTISTWCLQVLSICEVQNLPSPVLKCKSLILDTCVNKWDLPGIAFLLQNSSLLEKFTINICPSYNYQYNSDWPFASFYDFDEMKYWTSTKKHFEFLHLKTIELPVLEAGYDNEALVLQLLAFLIKNAWELESVVFGYEEEEIFSYTRELEEVVFGCEEGEFFRWIEVERQKLFRLVLYYLMVSLKAAAIFKPPRL